MQGSVEAVSHAVSKLSTQKVNVDIVHKGVGAMTKTPVYLELGRKRVFACALDWPGWCRSGSSPEAALDALAGYAKARAMPNPSPKNYEEWVTNQFGSRLFESADLRARTGVLDLQPGVVNRIRVVTGQGRLKRPETPALDPAKELVIDARARNTTPGQGNDHERDRRRVRDHGVRPHAPHPGAARPPAPDTPAR